MALSMKRGRWLAAPILALAVPAAVITTTVAASAATTHTTRHVPHASQAFVAPAGLDHFLCYRATLNPKSKPGFKIPPNLQLTDQFATFTPRFGPVTEHCNPALKQVVLPTGGIMSYPPKSPSWHYLCWQITAPVPQPIFTVKVTNQFGSAELTGEQPNQFCLPSLKSLVTPPVYQKPGKGEIKPDHLTCYPVKPVAGKPGFAPPGPVSVGDEFNGFKPQPIQVLQPTELCLPTEKTINGVVAAPIKHPKAHLQCFAITPPTPVISPIWDKNQFGAGQLVIAPASASTSENLCLPSAKKVVKIVLPPGPSRGAPLAIRLGRG